MIKKIILVLAASLFYLSTQGMNETEKHESSTITPYSILSLPEEVILKIWIAGFKKTVIYRVDNIYTIMRPITAVSCACKAWNILWKKEEKKLKDAAHDIKDPIYMQYSAAGCVIS